MEMNAKGFRKMDPASRGKAGNQFAFVFYMNGRLLLSNQGQS